MKITITQLWILGMAIVATGFLLDAFDGSLSADRMKYVAGVFSCTFGATVMGWVNKRNGFV